MNNEQLRNEFTMHTHAGHTAIHDSQLKDKDKILHSVQDDKERIVKN
ncbi:hypothetical protein [Gudongella oleilytica]|nr:hypothetical protein [Gudongella oleilytica]